MFTEHPDYPELHTHLKYFGYWRTMDRRCTRDTRPDPRNHVDLSWDSSERGLVVAHLRAGQVLYTWLGSSTCRFCGLRPNGRECLTDGTYGWPSGLAHTVEEHGFKPPQEFIDHVLKQAAGATPG